MPLSTRPRVALAAACGAIAAVALYAVLRFAQFLGGPEPNPATVLWSSHSGFLWRSATAIYAGGIAAFVAYLAAGRAPARVARSLVVLLTVATALLVAQATLAP